MALCGKVYDRVDIVIRHNPCDQIRIANIALDKVNTLGLLQRLKALSIEGKADIKGLDAVEVAEAVVVEETLNPNEV